MRVLYFLIPLLLTIGCSSDHGLSPVPDYPLVSVNDALDIVMVFDTSCSMNSDWAIIDYGLIRTTEQFYAEGMDINIALTSADWISPESARTPVWHELNPSPDIGWDMALALQEIKNNATGGEAGLAGALSAYQNFPSFFRRNSTPFFIMVSDENDQSSINGAGIPTQDFRNMIPSNSVITSIVGPADNSQSSCADPAPRYHAVSDLLIDICTQERWSIVDQLILN